MPEPLRYSRLWWGLGAGLLSVILIVSLWPLAEQQDAPPHSDKVLHAMTFAFLFIWFAGLAERGRRWQVFTGLLVYGLLMEVLQSLTPYRHMSVGDFLADAAGLGAGWLLCLAGLGGWAVRVEASLLAANKIGPDS